PASGECAAGPHRDGVRIEEPVMSEQDAERARAELEAVREGLRIISRMPAQLDTVLNEILGRAAHLCGAEQGTTPLREGDRLLAYAHFNPDPWAPAVGSSAPLDRGTVARTSVLEHRTIHVWGTNAELLQQYPDAPGPRRAPPDERMTVLSVPLLRGGEAIGQMQPRPRGGGAVCSDPAGPVGAFAGHALDSG